MAQNFAGGDFTTITFNHKDLGIRKFSLKAGEDIKLVDGGFKKTKTPSSIASRTRTALEAKLATATGIVIEIHSENDLKYIRSLTQSVNDYIITLNHINNSTYSGTGSITGDTELSLKEHTDFSCEITVTEWDIKT